jgi:hypothetical protein
MTASELQVIQSAGIRIEDVTPQIIALARVALERCHYIDQAAKWLIHALGADMKVTYISKPGESLKLLPDGSLVIAHPDRPPEILDVNTNHRRMLCQADGKPTPRPREFSDDGPPDS